MEEVMEIFGDNNLYTEVIKENLERRTLIFNNEVNDSLLENYIMYILKWNMEDRGREIESRQPIWLILNSGGGETLAGMNFLDVIKSSKTPIYCLVTSICASMASYIPMVCDTSYAFPNSVVCLHDGCVGVQQTSRKANDVMNFFHACDERLDDIVLNNTLITEEYLEDIADREYYIFAQEAKELGIFDYIIGIDCDIDEVL